MKVKKLVARTENISSIDESTTLSMYQLFETYYENTSFEKFVNDFREKDRVIVLRDKKTREIKGFSTLKELEVQVADKTVMGLFSGDTIIDPEYWGQTALTMEFFKNIILFKLRNLFKPVYWFLISKGHKTYLLLAHNFKNYFPRYDLETPSFEKKVMKTFAVNMFDELYNEEKNILCCAHKFDRLKNHIAPIDQRALTNPHIEFFVKNNPKWAKGDELCCIGRVDMGLAKRYLMRTFKKITLGKIIYGKERFSTST